MGNVHTEMIKSRHDMTVMTKSCFNGRINIDTRDSKVGKLLQNIGSSLSYKKMVSFIHHLIISCSAL